MAPLVARQRRLRTWKVSLRACPPVAAAWRLRRTQGLTAPGPGCCKRRLVRSSERLSSPAPGQIKTNMKKHIAAPLYLHRSAAGRAPAIKRRYDAKLKITPAYRDSLPDMMETGEPIPGLAGPIQQVGVSNFRLPLRFATKGGGVRTLEASITGTV